MKIRTTKQALAEAARRWGKRAIVEDQGPKFASTPEARAVAHAAHLQLRDKLTAEVGPREKWTKEQRSQVSDLMWASMRLRYKVGAVMMGMFFEVKGEGDSWDEAFLAVDHAEALDMEHTRVLRAKHEADERARRKRKATA